MVLCFGQVGRVTGGGIGGVVVSSGLACAWWWAGAVGLGPPLVALRVPDAPLPRRGTTVRTDGLWAALECEEPLVHWSVGMECFGVAYDDPWEAARSERGDVVPFGLDLSFVTSSLSWSGDDAYGMWCDVIGEVLLGDSRFSVDTMGARAHAWGPGGLPSPFVRVRGRGTPGPVVAVCPFKVPDGVWVETLCAPSDGGGPDEGDDEGGWVGRPGQP
jgi:hypothetical protein